MKKNEKYLLYGGLTLLFVLLPKLMGRPAWYTITDWLIPEFEGFLPSPKWDNRQYTWGYGTRAPGPSGTITKSKALSDMRAYLLNDYNYFAPLIARPLSAHQWAAFLSFSYNLGRENADNLLDNINSYNDAALADQWGKYVYSGGARNSDLVSRRGTEWQIWQGNLT